MARSVESGSTGDLLRVVRFRLPDRTTSTTRRFARGRVTVLGPVSCLPAVSTPVGVKARHATRLERQREEAATGHKRLRRRSLDGSKLKPGKTYKLRGSVVFSHSSHHVKLIATLKFRSCPTG